VAADTDPGVSAVVDRALADWRQGDCVLGEQWFVHRSTPLTDGETELRETAVAGLVVVTQSCDLVRKSTERPFVELSPLVELAPDDFEMAARGRRPKYGVVPALADKLLVADLDRTMTIEKSVVATWGRVCGCRSDAEARAFAGTLARKRERFAFPDDFNLLARRLRDRVAAKHDRQTDEGRALQELREIRVQARPDWNVQKVFLFFWFVREHADEAGPPLPWRDLLAAWLSLVQPAGRFMRVDGQVATLDDMTARDYVDSDRFDLDYLSAQAREGTGA